MIKELTENIELRPMSYFKIILNFLKNTFDFTRLAYQNSTPLKLVLGFTGYALQIK